LKNARGAAREGTGLDPADCTSFAGARSPAKIAGYHRAMTDELDPKELARIRRRDRDAEAEARALMRPGMGKVFKQILDTQAKEAQAAKEATKRRRAKTKP
jgi:hypothetical protein